MKSNFDQTQNRPADQLGLEVSTFREHESAFEGRYSREVFETLHLAYLPFLRPMFWTLASGLVGRILLLGNANIIGIWVDSICSVSARTPICRPVPGVFSDFSGAKFFVVLSVMTLAGFLSTLFFRIGFSRLSARAISKLYDEVTLRTSRFPLRFFDINPAGRVITRFSSDYNNVFRLFGGPLAEFFSIIFDLICMMILITIASPIYLPLIGLIALANWGLYRINRNRLRIERRKLSASRSPSIAHFAETTQGASTIRVFNRQSTFAKRFADLNMHYLKQRLDTARAVFGFSMQMSLLTASLLLLTGIAGFYLLRTGWLSIGSIGVAFTFVVLSGTSLQMFFEWLAQVEEAMTGVERLDDYLRRPLEPGAKLPAEHQFATGHAAYLANDEQVLRAKRLIETRAAAVDVEDLWFRYDQSLPYVLKGLRFHIEPGEKIGIIGRTGSGKTSFVQALFRLYPLASGQIRIAGISADETDLKLYRKNIALISQEPTLFRGTLRENLDLEQAYSDEALQRALERVGLNSWFAALPEGFASSVEERGRNLSAGERQLLCMARCLLQDAPVVVMDEATSSIDPQSEEILVRATQKFFSDRTQIIIAHRLSTLEYCSRILWLQHGEIQMFDTPDVVLPLFRKANLSIRPPDETPRIER